MQIMPLKISKCLSGHCILSILYKGWLKVKFMIVAPSHKKEYIIKVLNLAVKYACLVTCANCQDFQ